MNAPQEPKGWITGQIDINKLIAIALGVVFLIGMLIMALFVPNPTPVQIKAFEVTLALAAGGVGAAIPGSLNIKHGKLARASGALALVLIVLFFQSKINSSVLQFIEPTEPAQPVALQFLEMIDRNETSRAWEALDPAAIGYSIDNRDTFESITASVRAPLGHATSRVLQGMNSMQSPPGYPAGIYRGILYKTKLSGDGDKCRMEQVVLRATNDLTWRVFGYTISPMTIQC